MKFTTQIQRKALFFTTYSQDMLRQLGVMSGFLDDLSRVRAGFGRDATIHVSAQRVIFNRDKDVLSWPATGLRPDDNAQNWSWGTEQLINI